MFKIILVLFFLFFLFCFIIYPLFFDKHSNSFDLYFGVPGTGKTTLVAWFSRKFQKKGRDCYSNCDIKGNYMLEPLSDLGVLDINHAEIFIDEAGIDFNNRSFKSYPKNCNFFFKYHRHYDCNIYFFSQDLDVDVKIRKLATNYYLLKKSLIPFFIKRKCIKKKIDINDEGDIVDKHYFKFFGSRYFFAPKVWKMFNTTDRPKLKDFVPHKWDEIHEEVNYTKEESGLIEE